MRDASQRAAGAPHAARRGGLSLANAVEIRTDPDGVNLGRAYHFRAGSGAECRRVADDLHRLSAAARGRFEGRSRWARGRERLKAAYDSAWVQGLVGALIVSVGPPWPSLGRRDTGAGKQNEGGGRGGQGLVEVHCRWVRFCCCYFCRCRLLPLAATCCRLLPRHRVVGSAVAFPALAV